MGPRDWHPGIKDLKTKAVDNHGHRYRVYLELKPDVMQWVLVIADTPGHWYMSTLLQNPRLRDTIAIDYGQNWNVINFRQIMDEAIDLI